MISLKNVTKFYGSFKAVDNLSLTIENNIIYGLLGPNGAGKSTTLKMITGLTDISEGEIVIDGYNIATNPTEAKSNFGFVMDSPDMFLKLKVYEYLTFIGKIYGVPAALIKERMDEYLGLFNISDTFNDRIASLSHGMRQKVMVIGSLIHEPKTWILDEPMTGLDPASQHLIKELMRKHAAKGNAVIFSTHVLETAEKLCDRVGIINKGKLIYDGNLDDLKASTKDDSLEDIFLEMTKND